MPSKPSHATQFCRIDFYILATSHYDDTQSILSQNQGDTLIMTTSPQHIWHTAQRATKLLARQLLIATLTTSIVFAQTPPQTGQPASDTDIPPLPTQEEEIPPLPATDLPAEQPQQPATTPATTPPVTQREEPEYTLGERIKGRFINGFRAVAWLETTGYIVGTTMQRGQGMHSSRALTATTGGPQVMGYTIQERNGVLSGIVLAALAQLGIVLCAGVIASSAYQVTGVSTTRSYHADGSVWETTTTTYGLTADADEKFAASQVLVDAANDGSVLGISSYQGGQNFEFTYFTDDWMGRGLGQTQGVRMNFLLGIPAGKRLIFEGGWGWGRTTSDYNGARVESRFNGAPLRLIMPLGPLALQAGWDANLAILTKFFADEPDFGTELVTPAPLSLSLHAFLWRLHLTAGVELSRVFKLDTAYNLGAGMRF